MFKNKFKYDIEREKDLLVSSIVVFVLFTLVVFGVTVLTHATITELGFNKGAGYLLYIVPTVTVYKLYKGIKTSSMEL